MKVTLLFFSFALSFLVQDHKAAGQPEQPDYRFLQTYGPPKTNSSMKVNEPARIGTRTGTFRGSKWDQFVCSPEGEISSYYCVPFTIDPSITDKNEIYRAMNWFKTRTCVAFVFRSTERDYINIRPGSSWGCFSEVHGRKGGQQFVELTSGCVQYPQGSFHELMHAIGFIHLHQRPDRDNYLYINQTNVDPQSSYAFDKFSNRTVTLYPWDWDSLMLYGSTSFQRQPNCKTSDCWTLMTRQGAYVPQIYEKSSPSEGDYLAVNKYYGCAG